MKSAVYLKYYNMKEESQQTPQGDIITNLPHLGLIKVAGDDAEKFLQGQFTNDVRKVTAESHQSTAWCTHKGRILVSFWLFKRDDAYYLLLPQDSVDSTIKRLHKYQLRAAVKLEKMSDSLSRIGIAGPNSTQILTDCLGETPPSNINASLTVNAITVLHIPGTLPRYIVFTEIPQALWQCASKIAYPVEANAWQLLDILAGLPQILPATAEAFVPQMVNFQAIEGVSFKKGCYTGQEVVARMRYLGTLKRRMYLAIIDTDVIPQPGELLYISDSDESVGQILNAVAYPKGGAIVLAVIQISHAHKTHWQSQQGKALKLMDLPYVLENEEISK